MRPATDRGVPVVSYVGGTVAGRVKSTSQPGGRGVEDFADGVLGETGLVATANCIGGIVRAMFGKVCCLLVVLAYRRQQGPVIRWYSSTS